MNKWWKMLVFVNGLLLTGTALADGLLGAHVSVQAANGEAFNNNYAVLGVSASYDVLDGLSLGASAQKWLGSSPGIMSVSPFLQYQLNILPIVHPYVGAFYKHTNVDGLPGINSVGTRAGIELWSGMGASFNVGVVHESYRNCDPAIYKSCSVTYSEAGLSYGF